MGFFDAWSAALGVSTTTGNILISFLINIFVVILILAFFHDQEYKVEMAILGFFGMLLIEALFLGGIMWLAFILPLIIIAVGWANVKRKE